MKFVGSMQAGTSTVDVRRQVRRAKNDPNVQKVLVVIDSGGGTVAGTQELAADLAELAAAKPTHVYVDSMMASAALWVGSQAAVISASPTSLVGSIGGVMAVADFSQWAKREGIKVHVITSDGAEKFKGAGVEGSKITAEQLANWKGLLNSLCGHFFDEVAAGRGMTRVAVDKLADGRVHLAADAKALGLIDHVESIDAAMGRLRAASPASKKKQKMRADAPADPARAAVTDVIQSGGTSAGESSTPAAAAAGVPSGSEADSGGATASPELETHMSQTQQGGASAAAAAAPAPEQPKADTTIQQAGPTPATLGELKAAFPGDLAFAVEMYENGHTLAEAKSIDGIVQSRVARVTAAAAGATAAAEPEKKKAGVRPLEGKAAEQQQSTAAAGGDAAAILEERVGALVGKGVSRQKAVAQVFAADEQLRQDYVAAVNAAKK
jgi:signal peptide peptidase SppA